MKDLFKIMYIIVDKQGRGDIKTLAYCRKDCIAGFLEFTNASWDEAKKIGWRRERVDVNVTSAFPDQRQRNRGNH